MWAGVLLALGLGLEGAMDNLKPRSIQVDKQPALEMSKNHTHFVASGSSATNSLLAATTGLSIQPRGPTGASTLASSAVAWKNHHHSNALFDLEGMCDKTWVKENGYMGECIQANNQKEHPLKAGFLKILTQLDTFLKQTVGSHPVLVEGTLMGQKRDGQIIPWDNDADVALPVEKWKKLEAMVGNQMMDAGNGVAIAKTKEDMNRFVFRVCLSDNAKKFVAANEKGPAVPSAPFVDLYRADGLPELPPKFFEAEVCNLDGVALHCPPAAVAKDFLDKQYPGWQTPDHTWDGTQWRTAKVDAKEVPSQVVVAKDGAQLVSSNASQVVVAKDGAPLVSSNASSLKL